MAEKNTFIQSTVASSSSQTNLIVLNTTQLPVKLTPENYPSWKAQFDSLLFGYDLFGYIDGSNPCPPKEFTVDGKQSLNPEFTLW
ncbi:hypothetical protein Vadar_022497 [Vaccinium darrowii]|uniref:Uncharacterized protein n=1 Tax=Vaccinium darrowii TaxID=229202 RepID=A0ACB7XBS1_9ERIC|nr:hypothetical protein Vadar_022497 [Vaccinium darrowii]